MNFVPQVLRAYQADPAILSPPRSVRTTSPSPAGLFDVLFAYRAGTIAWLPVTNLAPPPAQDIPPRTLEWLRRLSTGHRKLLHRFLDAAGIRLQVEVSIPPVADILAGVKADPDLSQIISSEAHFIATIGATGLAPDRIIQFQSLILSYYTHFGRDLPWRETSNPYHILVSEIMLQQTQVARVLPKYHEFLEAFPDVQTLAAAPLGEVLAVWQGMGYNRRAIALQRTAKILVEQYNGELPRDIAILVQLPGIGRATASAIVVYAFNTPAIYIETNVRRVMIHFFFQDRSGIGDSEIEPIVKNTLYREHPRLWFNALMDYGAWLKTREQNPNLRSSAYKKQSPFEGSDRQIRGNILKIVLEKGAIAEGALIETIAGEKERIQTLLVELEKEGFIHRTGGIVSIAKTGAL